MSKAENTRFERLLAVLLQPIARLIIANDLPLTRVVEILKRALVAAAESDDGETDSRISLRTGVHRKDVKRLRRGDHHTDTSRTVATPLAAVLTSWTQDPEFIDSKGHPRALPRRQSAAGPGFDELVKVTKIDAPPATVLAELVAQGLVSVEEDDLLILESDTYLPKVGEAVLDALEATLVDHLKVSVENALSSATDEKAFDRVLRYSHLSDTSIERLEKASRLAALDYLKQMNALAHKYQLADASRHEAAKGHFVTGVFVAPTPAGTPLNNEDEKST